MTGGELNLEWASEIIWTLAAHGVEEVEVAPGSRSAPLVLALISCPGLRVRVHLDERSAGFFALGYGRRARRPAVVLTTSGTAVANLLPSVVEADASDVPMVVVTADRPPHLRGADANQTIDQVGVFKRWVRFEADLPVPNPRALGEVGKIVDRAVAASWGEPGGPVHLNVPFEKPLQPASADEWRKGVRRALLLGAEVPEAGEAVAPGETPVDHTTPSVIQKADMPGAEEAVRQEEIPGGRPAGLAHCKGCRVAFRRSAPLCPNCGVAVGRAAGSGTDCKECGSVVVQASPQTRAADGGGHSHHRRYPLSVCPKCGATVAKEGPKIRVERLSSSNERLLARSLENAERAVIVAGPSTNPDGEGEIIARFGREHRIPVLADPLSGARHVEVEGAPVIGGYDHFLRVDEVQRQLMPDLVLRFGRSPTSATLEGVVADWSAATQIVIDAGARPKDHQAVAAHVVKAPATVLATLDLAGKRRGGDDGWLRAWIQAERSTWAALSRIDSFFHPENEGAYAAAVLRALPAGATLFASSSMPVRDIDAYGEPCGRRVRLLGNRGASGIDGVVSSVLGTVAGGPGPVVGLLGDLAFYHDMNGLLAARDKDLNAVLVVLDNDGGGIFHMLPISAFEPAFTPFFATPHGLDFVHAARMYGIAFQDVKSPLELEQAVTAAVGCRGVEVIRVRTDRSANRRRHEEVQKEVAKVLTREIRVGT